MAITFQSIVNLYSISNETLRKQLTALSTVIAQQLKSNVDLSPLIESILSQIKAELNKQDYKTAPQDVKNLALLFKDLSCGILIESLNKAFSEELKGAKPTAKFFQDRLNAGNSAALSSTSTIVSNLAENKPNPLDEHTKRKREEKQAFEEAKEAYESLMLKSIWPHECSSLDDMRLTIARAIKYAALMSTIPQQPLFLDAELNIKITLQKNELKNAAQRVLTHLCVKKLVTDTLASEICRDYGMNLIALGLDTPIATTTETTSSTKSPNPRG